MFLYQLWIIVLGIESIRISPTNYDFYRTRFHVQPKFNWMNDPCAPFFNGTHYHLFLQYNPHGYNWGNMSWYHVSSPDLIHWQDEELALLNDSPFDNEGVFSGSALPVGYQGLPTIMYTAVSKLPIGWKLNYNLGSEKQALAVSLDGGHSWKKIPEKPVISAPPPYMSVTGWRDPFIFRSDKFESAFVASYNNVRKPNPRAVFCVVSGGEKGKGGRLFLYRSVDFIHWNYLGVLFGENAATLVGNGPARFSFNFEVSNVFSLPVSPHFHTNEGMPLLLKDSQRKRWSDSNDLNKMTFIILGVEGTRKIHDSHWPLWVAGNVTPDDGVKFASTASGILDWGSFYAANSFEDPKTKRRILFGWSNDENEAIRKAQGWGGLVALPRELFVKEYKNIVNFNKIRDQKSFVIVSKRSSRRTSPLIVRTLGIRPIREVSRYFRTPFTPTPLMLEHVKDPKILQDTGFEGIFYKISCTIRFPLNAKKGRVGFQIRSSADGIEKTLVYIDLYQKKITIDKTDTSMNATIDSTIETGNFELFETVNPIGEKEMESLQLDIFVDNSIVEVFANERFALTGRIYPTSGDSTKLFYWADTKQFWMQHMSIFPIKDSAFRNRMHRPSPNADSFFNFG